MISLPRPCPPDFQPVWSETDETIIGRYAGLSMGAKKSWERGREAVRQSLWLSAEVIRLSPQTGAKPK